MQLFRCHTFLPAITLASMAAALVRFGIFRWLSMVSATKISTLSSVLTTKKARVPRLVTVAPPGRMREPGAP